DSVRGPAGARAPLEPATAAALAARSARRLELLNGPSPP
ncbi:MAG: hypothetical protein QOG57_6234, partial [Pseudonocardiales bacterium]|nr:hypothetical protein [Pseudonocardiales bacterium]